MKLITQVLKNQSRTFNRCVLIKYISILLFVFPITFNLLGQNCVNNTNIAQYEGFGIVGTMNADLYGFTDLSGAPTLLQANALGGYPANHLATDYVRDRLIFSLNGAQSDMFAYNFSTGTVTTIGSGILSSLGNSTGGAVFHNGEYYIFDDNYDGAIAEVGLFKVTFDAIGNAATLTEVAEVGILNDLTLPNGQGDIAIDTDGTLYALESITPGLSANGELWSIDLNAATPTWSLIGNPNLPATSQLFIDNIGRLIANEGAGDFVELSKTTGQIIDNTFDMSGSNVAWADLSEGGQVVSCPPIIDGCTVDNTSIAQYEGFGIVGTTNADLYGFTDLSGAPTLLQSYILGEYPANHLATDYTRDRLIFTLDGAQSDMFAYNFSTGTVTTIGSGILSSLGNSTGGAVFYNGEYYIFDDNYDGATSEVGLFKVTFDVFGNAASLTEVAEVGIQYDTTLPNGQGDIAIDTDGILYALESDTPGTSANAELWMINLNSVTPTWSLIGNTGMPGFSQLFIDNAGRLIANYGAGDFVELSKTTGQIIDNTFDMSGSNVAWADLSEGGQVVSCPDVVECTTSTEYASSIEYESGVSYENNIIGAPDNSYASFYSSGHVVILDLLYTLSDGDDYTIRWRHNPGLLSLLGGPGVMKVEESQDGVTWRDATGSSVTLSSTSFYDTDFQSNGLTRYLRLTRLNSSSLLFSSHDVDIDAISFTICEDSGGGGTPVPPVLEDCNNGIDDDGDGFADCSDSECSCYTPVTCGSRLFLTTKLTSNEPGIGSAGDFILYETKGETTVSVEFVANLTTNGLGAGQINAVGFHPTDRHIYGMDEAYPFELYRINGSYQVENLGGISGIPSNYVALFSGDFDKNSNFFFIAEDQNGDQLLYQLDIDTRVATLVKDFNFDPNIKDIAFNPIDGYIYAWRGDEHRLAKIDPVTWTMTNVGPPNPVYDRAASLYFDPEGSLLAYVDKTTVGSSTDGFETLIRINTTTGLVSELGQDKFTVRSDGCSCPYYIKMNKSAAATVIGGDTLAYTIDLYNSTGGIINNAVFRDTLPSGLVFATDPQEVSEGLVITGSSVGQQISTLQVESIPQGHSSFVLKIVTPSCFDMSSISNQAYLDSLSSAYSLIASTIKSDNPAVTFINEPTVTSIHCSCMETTNAFYATFEDSNGDNDWNQGSQGSGTNSAGYFEQGNPEATAYQLNAAYAGSNVIITGRTAGSSDGSNDLDGGFTRMESPSFTISSEATSATLSFWYYVSHDNRSGSEDYLQLIVEGNSNTIVFDERGSSSLRSPNWQHVEIDMTPWAGQTISFRAEANSTTASFFEAAMDEIRVSQEAPCLEVCDNNLDDDGDGLVDNNDPDCTCGTTGLNFWSPTLVSGTDGQVGAVYRYNNVKNGVYALVRINSKSHSNISISNIDQDTINGGYYNAFQPVIDFDFGSAGDREVTFQFDFYDVNTDIPVDLNDLYVTAVDVDGDNSAIREYISTNGFNSYAVESPSLLNLSGALKATGPYTVFSGVDENAYETLIEYIFDYPQSLIITLGANYDGGANNGDERMSCVYFKCYGLNTVTDCQDVLASSNMTNGCRDTYYLETTLTGSSGTCTTQWQKKINGVWTDIIGATSTIYTPTLDNDSTYYRAISNCTGNSTCMNVPSNTVTAPPLFWGDASAAQDSICEGSSVDITVVGHGSDSYFYNWGSLGTGADKSVAPTATTTYTVTVTGADNCTVTADVTVHVNAAPAANAGSDKAICLGDNTTIEGVDNGVSYSWTPVIGLDNPSIHNPTADPNTTTTYTLTVIDNNGCSATDEVVVTVNPLPTASISGPSDFCEGTSVQLIASATGGNNSSYEYLWSPNDNTLNNINIANPIASPNSTTTYTVEVTDASGCVDTETIVLTENSAPNANAGVDQTICDNGSVTLSASGGISYSWNNGSTLSQTNISNPIASPSSTTTYTVTVEDSEGCTAVDQVLVTVNSTLAVDLGSDVEICTGESVTMTASATGGNSASYTFDWSHTVSNSSSQTESPFATTYYTVTVTDANGCTASDEMIIAVSEMVGAGTIDGAQSMCGSYDPDELTSISAPRLSGNGGINNLVLDIDFDAENVTDDSGNSHNGTEVGTLSYESGIVERGLELQGAGHIEVSDHADLKPTAITLSAWLKPESANPTDYSTALYKSSDSNWDDGYGLAHYTGSSNINFYVNDRATKSVSALLPEGVYSHVVGTYDGITLKLYINGTITSAMTLNESIVHSNQPLLIGHGTGGANWSGGIDEVQIYDRALTQQEIDLIYSRYTDIEYVWQYTDVNNPSWVDIGGANGPTYDPNTISLTTSYRRRARLTECTSNWLVSNTIIKVVNEAPVAFAGNDVTICDGESVMLTATGGSTYQWEDDGTITDINAQSPTVSPDITRTYTVTVSDGNGCSSTDDVQVEVKNLRLSREITRPSCPGANDASIDMDILGAAGPYNIDWDYNGLGDTDDAQLITNLSTGTYNVTVTETTSMCSQTMSVQIDSINDNPYSSLILTAADNSTFPTNTVPGGHYYVFPTGAESLDATFDHSYLDGFYELHSDWRGETRLNYLIFDNNPASGVSHNVGSDMTEYHADEAGTLPNESGEVYDMYGEGIFNFEYGTTESHNWQMTFDFSNMENGYLPANTQLGLHGIEGAAYNNETMTFSANLSGGGGSPWMTTSAVDRGYGQNSPTMPDPLYVPVTNEYYFNSSQVNEAASLFVTTENVTSITVTLTASNSNGSNPYAFGLKLAAPVQPINFNVTDSNPNCISDNGEIHISPKKIGLSYSIDNGSTWSTDTSFTDLPVDDYDILVRNDVTGCTKDLGTISLSRPPCIEICTDGDDNDDDGLVDCDDPDCYKNLNTQLVTSDPRLCLPGAIDISATVSGGTKSYSFAWDNALGVDSTHSISPSTSTIYNVTVTDANLCTTTDQLVVDVFDSPTVTATPEASVSCMGVGVSLFATGGVLFDWSPTTGLTNHEIANPIADPTVNTTYYVTVTDINGCTGIDSVYVEAASNMSANAGGQDETICAGSSVQLTATGGDVYSWTPATGLSNANIFNPVASPESTTIYTVEVTDSNGCTDTDQITVTVLANPNGNITQDSIDICLGSSTSLLASGGDNYYWSPSNGLNNANINSPVASPLVTTLYTVIVEDSNGCTSTDEVLVKVKINENANAGADVEICEDESVELDASGGLLYSWSPSTGLSSTNARNPIAQPNATTNYSVTVTDENGCTGVDVVRVTVHDKPVPTSGGNRYICEGESVSLSAGGGVSYQWFPSTGLNFDDISNPTANPTNTTTYNVIVTDVQGCTASTLVSVVVNSNPIVTISNDTLDYCVGAGSVQLSVSGGSSYEWSPAQGLSNPNIRNPQASPTANTNYIVTVTDANNCSSTGEVLVRVYSNIGNADAGEDQLMCLGESVTLNASGGTTYQWSPSDGLSATNIPNPVASPESPTTYTVIATDENGCTDSDEVTVMVGGLIRADAGPDLEICEGDSVQLFATGGVSYEWSPSETLSDGDIANPFAKPLQLTTYVVTATDANACTSTDNVVVTVYPRPVIQVQQDTFIICGTSTADFFVSGGSQYAWSPGAGLSATDIHNPIADPANSTLYTVTVTNVWGCQSTATIFVDKDAAGDPDGDGICSEFDNCINTFNPDQLDTDNDGLGDACDIDDDNDGITDADEMATAGNGGDTDGDGIPDHLDLDSDNDGILDLVEANIPSALDLNNNGIIDPSNDFGINGYADDLETSAESGISSIPIPNTDGQSGPNFQDLDSDDDGFCDLLESGVNTDFMDFDHNGVLDGLDSDGDGILDISDSDDLNFGSPGHHTPRSMDNSVHPDYTDSDRDDPGDFEGDGDDDDVREAGYLDYDTDLDGRIDFTADVDYDGIVDNIDANTLVFGGLCIELTDNNTPPIAIADIFFTDFGQSLYFNPSVNDFDTDGEIDSSTFEFVTFPSPNEGNAIFNELNGTLFFVPADGFEGQVSFRYTIRDVAGDVSNIATITIVVGTPKDIVTSPDIRFTGKNQPVSIEVLQNDYSSVADLDTATLTLLSSPPHGDAIIAQPGIVNYVPDNEFEGIDNFLYEVTDKLGNGSNPTSVEVFVFDTLNIVLALDDIHRLRDTITVDISHNDRSFPHTIDASTVEITQEPQFGEVSILSDGRIHYEADFLFDGTDHMKYIVKDNSGQISNQANVILLVNMDTDGDGIPNLIDLDDDNDGISDEDEIINASNFGDSDEDGVPDHLDLDSDNDGTNDVIESGGTDTNGDGMADGAVNEQGVADSADLDRVIPDEDGDDIPNYLDLDSDDDGVNDLTESGNVLYGDFDGDSRLDDGDADRDGITDIADNLDNTWSEISDFEPQDTDSDGIYNLNDDDDDNDRVLTIDEDTNQDSDWYNDDNDNDGLVDYLDPDQFVFLKMKVFLQGCYDEASGLMRDDLRKKGYLPTVEPYTELGETYHQGGETVNPQVFDVTGPDAIVDWVLIELRDSSNNTMLNHSRPALLQRDGDVVDLDGVSVIKILNRPHRRYQVCIRHRNHLSIMTAQPMMLNNKVNYVDFTVESTNTYVKTGGFSTTYPQKVYPSGVRALWAGNVDFNDRVLFQGGTVDPTAIFLDVLLHPNNVDFLTNFILSGYQRGDTNMDGTALFQGSNNDVDMIFFNNVLHPENTNLNPNFIINQQMPEVKSVDEQ